VVRTGDAEDRSVDWAAIDDGVWSARQLRSTARPGVAAAVLHPMAGDEVDADT
jgi:hypothetical protein